MNEKIIRNMILATMLGSETAAEEHAKAAGGVAFWSSDEGDVA